MSKHTREVAHPRFYMAVKGKLTHIPQGTTVEVTDEQIKVHGTKLANPGEGKTLQGGRLVDSSDAKTSGHSDEEIEAGYRKHLDELEEDHDKALEAADADLEKADIRANEAEASEKVVTDWLHELDETSKDAASKAQTAMVYMQEQLTKAQAEVAKLKKAAKN